MARQSSSEISMLAGEKEDDIFRDIYGGFLLGKAQFIKEKLKELKDKISYSKELHLGIEPDVIIEEVARRFKKNPQDLIDSKKRPAIEKQAAIYLIRRHTGLTNGEIEQDIQDESAGSEQGRHKDREVGEGEQEDKESGKQANFYFRGLTPLLSHGLTFSAFDISQR